MDIEVSDPPRSIGGLDTYELLQLLVRLHGTPLGYVEVPVIRGSCEASAIGRAILKQQSRALIRQLLLRRFCTGLKDFDELIKTPPPDYSSASLPLVTVAVCTRDCPAEDLKLCLDSLNHLNYPNLDILIIDNAPCSLSTKNLVADHYPRMRYICEERPGLNWARNRAILEARGDIIAFTDDDVIVDPGWIQALAAVFDEEPETMTVTGPVVPYEIETEAQELFERYGNIPHGGFCKGFSRKWYPDVVKSYRQTAKKSYKHSTGRKYASRKASKGPSSKSKGSKTGPMGRTYAGSGRFGTGANMAYRRSLFDRIGYFDPALDVGTVSEGGGDLEMFFRVIKEGYMLVYEPNALVRHRHRRDYADLRRQIASWGIGFSAHLMRSFMEYPDERPGLFRLYTWWIGQKICVVLASFMYPNRRRDLHLLEFKGLFKGPFRYHRARSQTHKIIKTCGPPAYLEAVPKSIPQESGSEPKGGTAVRSVDIAKPLPILDDVAEYSTVRVYVQRGDMPIGSMHIPTLGQPLRRTRLREALVDHLGTRLLNPDCDLEYDTLRAEAYAALERHLLHADSGKQLKDPVCLSNDYSVSIILATSDRPDDLRHCLNSIMAQKSTRKMEIIVIDNNPLSGLTPPAVADFPNVTLLEEQRRGSSYARNTGISASTGDIIVTIDDDETAPPGWLEKLIAPFVRSDVMIVTGNILPVELETPAQHLFEIYGGLGRGFEPREVNRAWFESSARRVVQTWMLGGTANSAYRASIFADPRIGLFDESLGAPFGVGEDTYMFYKVLKAGYSILYEPKAYLFHKHRRSFKALRSQIYNYSKGHVAYHLTTFFNDQDFRALVRLFFGLPPYHIKRLILRILGRINYPLSMILCEITGNLVGPLAFLRSRRRVKLTCPQYLYQVLS